MSTFGPDSNTGPKVHFRCISNTFLDQKLNNSSKNLESDNFGTMKGQQVMMQYIQKGEMALQQGMEGEAINSFSMAACISYIGQGMTHIYYSSLYHFLPRGNKS